jgi:hypothetical protein
VDDVEGQGVSVLLGVVLGSVVVVVVVAAAAVVVTATSLCVVPTAELKRDKRDVLPPPTPTAGTLPSSFLAARRGRLKVIGSRPGRRT